MRASALLREVTLNIVSGTTRALVFFSVLTVLLGTLVSMDAGATQRLIVDAQTFKDSGASILVLTSPQAVSGDACQALTEIPGVTASGALRASTSKLTLALLPASPVPVYEVTPTFGEVLGVHETPSSGALVPDDLLEALGARVGDRLTTDNGMLHAAAEYSYPADGRRNGFAWAALLPVAVPSDAEAFDECWVSAWPFDTSLKKILLGVIDVNAAAVQGPAMSYEVSQLNTRHGTSPRSAVDFTSRATALAPFAAIAIGWIAGAVSIRLRRLEFAGRLHHRARRSTVVALALLETSFWAFMAAGAAILPAVLVSLTLSHDDGVAVLTLAAATTAIGALSAVVGATITSLFVRERMLFRYFAER